jgi:lipopolysaccharide/colanic/teichoic acid biosynthesis glycosyltransferase
MTQQHKTKTRYLPALCLAVASPVIAELLSSSTPPLLFFIWWVFILFVLLYGSCCLLIRELTVRWGSGWTGILVLGAAFGILDEGILTRAFFDPAWPSLGPLAGHGRWFEINVIWTLDAILYHAILSMAVPIQLIHLIFPSTAKEPWLRRRHLWAIAVLLGLTIVMFLKAGNKYPVDSWYLVACIGAIAFLFVLARFAGVQPARHLPPVHQGAGRFFLLGFGALAAILLQMYVLPLLQWPALTLAALFIIIYFGKRTLRRWTGNGERWTPGQQFGLIGGMLACLAIIGGIQEVNPSRIPRPAGTIAVAAGSFVFLIGMQRVIRRENALVVAVEPKARAMAMAAAASTSGASTAFGSAAVAIRQLETMEDDSPVSDIPLILRAVEIAIASNALILTFPIMLVLAVLIRRDTPGPVLFFQSRLGRNCVPFRFVKFRTFYTDARRLFPHLYAYEYTPRQLETLKFKIVRDPRITSQGEWMRKSTLDELPNFWNVLTGDMALVGPRPEIPEMLRYYTGDMRLKFSVRPGVTGLAQISGRGRLGFYETVEYDLEYVKTRSLALDLKILALTAFKMISRDGAF